MREFVIVGRPNSGKTLFTLNFAAYNGNKSVDITFCNHNGTTTCRHFSITEAKDQLCNMTVHKTRSFQSLILKMVRGKATIFFKITDTCGIVETIHPDENIRRGMSQTLNLLRSADYILHIIDTASLSSNPTNIIDQEIYNYGMIRKCYSIIANKMDLPAANSNLTTLAKLFPQGEILPVSSLFSQGFKEVKTCVARNL